jgi:hypothetical protein
LCDVIGVVAEFMVSVVGQETISFWAQFTVPAGESNEHPRGMPFLTAWQRFKRSKGVQLNAILKCKFPSKNANQPQPNGDNPNTAESMVKKRAPYQPTHKVFDWKRSLSCEPFSVSVVPSVFGRNLQCEPVRK